MPLSIVCLLLCAAIAAAVRLPFLQNQILVPKSNASSFTLANRTCDECLCESNVSHSILNCFPNNTCEFFVDAPRSYKFQSTLNGTVLFPQRILPMPSEGCMPNTTELLNRLNATTPTYASVSGPRCLVIDNHGYLVTVSFSDKSIVRFHADNLTRIEQPVPAVFSDRPRSIAYNNGAYYVGFAKYILVVDNSNMTQIHNISSSLLNGVRDMIFLRNGQLMIVSSADNNRTLFFNRSNVEPHNYDFIGFRNVGYGTPHGLLSINDASFYAISHMSNNVYAYSNAGNATEWMESLVLNASSVTGFSGGSHLSMDKCDRFWLSLGSHGIWIFNSQGSHLGTLNMTSVDVYDTLILDNHLIYVSDYSSNRIIRIDPHIRC